MASSTSRIDCRICARPVEGIRRATNAVRVLSQTFAEAALTSKQFEKRLRDLNRMLNPKGMVEGRNKMDREIRSIHFDDEASFYWEKDSTSLSRIFKCSWCHEQFYVIRGHHGLFVTNPEETKEKMKEGLINAFWTHLRERHGYRPEQEKKMRRIIINGKTKA